MYEQGVPFQTASRNMTRGKFKQKYGSIRSTGLGMVMQMPILGSDFEIWNEDIFNELPPVCRNFCRNACGHVGRVILCMPVCIGTTKSAEIVINVDYDMHHFFH